MRRAKGKAALVVAAGHGVEARLADRDDGGQDHDAQQHGGGKQAHALAALDVEHGFEERRLDHGLHGGHKHDHAEETVDDGRDAGQQLHRREHDLIDAGRRELGHVDGR